MSFFNHVQLHKYDLTDKGVSQACYDEIVIDNPVLEDVLTTEQIQVLADEMRERDSRTTCVLSSRRGGLYDYGVI